MNRSVPMRAAAIAAFTAALLLAGCGRKGGLQLPPAATATPQESALPVEEQQQQSLLQPSFDTAAKPVAPVGRKRRLPMDVLID